MKGMTKISVKLAGFFSLALIVFSVIIGLVFLSLFRNYMTDFQKNELLERAETIADTISNFSESSGQQGGRRQGFGQYTRFIDDLAMADVWIVDRELNIVVGGNVSMRQVSYSELPEDAEKVVSEVFAGKTAFGESFSSLLGVEALTAGAPIYSGSEVMGAVLLHSPLEDLKDAYRQGSYILYGSIALALAVSLILSALLAVTLTKPLRKMNSAALELASENYDTKTNVTRKDELGTLAASLDLLAGRLRASSLEREQLSRLRKEFTANISHELRTPVTVIRGSLEALTDGVVTDGAMVAEYHTQMLIETKYLERLVNDLLELTRLQNPEFRMEVSEFEMSEVLSDAVRSARRLASDKEVTLNVSGLEPSGIVSGDYGRLRQLLLIILDNAIKFSPEGSVIEVRSGKGSISVTDHGAGIKEQELPYIFDRFYKARDEKNPGGTGLGLAIAKEISIRHSMEISAKSQSGSGTTFTLRWKSQQVV